MKRVCLALALMMLSVVSANSALAAPDATEQALLERLRSGGYVVYWRHTATDRRQRDTDFSDMDRCATQRNLSEQGRTEARAAGALFVEYGVPVGEVLSSDFCRNRETAALAFGRYERVADLWNLPQARAGGHDSDQLAVALRKRLATQPRDPEANTVIVGHNLNLQVAAGVVLDEADMAVFRPLGVRGFELEGVIRASAFR
jgi:phosphohistidine phosphatase SixA